MPRFVHQLRHFATALSLLLLVSIPVGALAQTKPTRTDAGPDPVRSLLWIGNSFFYYNNSMHGHYNELTAAADAATRSRGVSVTISGSGLDWHDVASYLQPNGIGKYSFAPGNKIVFNPPGRQFDGVIMMDCSQCPIHPQLEGAFHASVKKDAEIVARYGARPILFMSWAYKDKPEMTAQLAEQYTLAGNANNALVIPAGLAFAKAMAKRPEPRALSARPAPPPRSPAPTSRPARAMRRYRRSRRSASSTPPGSTRKPRRSFSRLRRIPHGSTSAGQSDLGAPAQVSCPKSVCAFPVGRRRGALSSSCACASRSA